MNNNIKTKPTVTKCIKCIICNRSDGLLMASNPIEYFHYKCYKKRKEWFWKLQTSEKIPINFGKSIKK